jgi:hypothetical protein
VGAILTLSVPRIRGARGEITTMLWCVGTCGIGSTQTPERNANGEWMVTGTTGIGFIS